MLRHLALDNSRAAEHDNRGSNLLLQQRELRLEEFQLQPHRPQSGPGQQIHITFGQSVARGSENRFELASTSCFKFRLGCLIRRVIPRSWTVRRSDLNAES